MNFTRPEKHSDKPFIRFKIPDFEHVFFNGATLLCDVSIARFSLEPPSNFLNEYSLILYLQAEIIELFGDHNIYIDTIHGKVVEKDEDFIVYEYKIDLSNKINKEISVRVSAPVTFILGIDRWSQTF